jgi:hypothetical protein
LAVVPEEQAEAPVAKLFSKPMFVLGPQRSALAVSRQRRVSWNLLGRDFVEAGQELCIGLLLVAFGVFFLRFFGS